MKLHAKLLLPLVAIFAVIVGYFYLAWMPALRADAESDFQASISSHLDSVSEVIVPLLLASQLDVLHENMEALLIGNPDWKAIVVTDSLGRILYPLRGQELPKAGPGQVLACFDRPVQVGSMSLGQLKVCIDRGPSLTRQSHRMFQLGLAFVAFTLIMLAMSVLVMEGAVLGPLRSLVRASKALARRDFDAPLPPVRHDEMGELVDAFATMRAARRAAEQTLAEGRREAERTRQERELILSAPQEGICGVTLDGMVSFINPAGRRLLGWGDDEGIGAPLHATCQHHRADGTLYPYEQCPVFATLADGNPREIGGEVFWRRDGSCFPVDYSVAAIRRDDGIAGAVVVFRDISQRRAIEQALTSKSEALERSNVELEQLAYVASHDLREPLRMVSSYVTLLERRYADKLDDEARQFIAFAREGAMRMDMLVLDLLEFSRIGREARPKEPLAVQAIVDDALLPLQLEIQSQAATVEVSPTLAALPPLLGYRDELGRLLNNLLANALQYRQPGRPAKIRLDGRREGDWVVLSVADNGIGIDPQYFSRIFLIFQRLHTHDQYPGSGIGLAICKRIAEQHGGRIWLDSTPGAGSTFHVRLPVAGVGSGGARVETSAAETL